MKDMISCGSPLGDLLLIANDGALTHCLFAADEDREALGPCRDGAQSQLLRQAAEQLQAYFAGALEEFTLPLAPQGSEFQRQVWQALRQIPYGETISYGELARRIDRPKASRAVGLANGQNPLSIFIPCHRVIGANGALVGYGGGLWRKTLLLDLERGRQRLGL